MCSLSEKLQECMAKAVALEAELADAKDMKDFVLSAREENRHYSKKAIEFVRKLAECEIPPEQEDAGMDAGKVWQYVGVLQGYIEDIKNEAKIVLGEK